jgi:hypothetical protein
MGFGFTGYGSWRIGPSSRCPSDNGPRRLGPTLCRRVPYPAPTLGPHVSVGGNADRRRIRSQDSVRPDCPAGRTARARPMYVLITPSPHDDLGEVQPHGASALRTLASETEPEPNEVREGRQTWRSHWPERTPRHGLTCGGFRLRTRANTVIPANGHESKRYERFRLDQREGGR